MHTTPILCPVAQERKNERGAALITTLLISMLLLAAGGALIVSTSMTTSNTYDSTAETQAYYSAEAGLQAALNVLRGRVTLSNPLRIDTTKAATEPENQIDFRKAIELGTSNDTTSTTVADTSTDARLSRWLTYHTSNTTTANSNGPRVTLDNNFVGYSLKVTDPDNSKFITFSSSGSIDGTANSKTFTGSGNATISVAASASATVTAYPTIASQQLFSLTASASGGAVTIPAGTPFIITITQPTPFNTTATFRGTITNSNNTGAATISNTAINAALKFDSLSVSSGGAVYKITNNTASTNLLPLILGTKDATGSITAPKPKRLLVQSTGNGPRGAVKQLQLLVNDSFDIPVVAPIVIRGADDGTVMSTLSFGNSNGTLTGTDTASPPVPMRPAVVVSYHDRNKAAIAVGNYGNTGIPTTGGTAPPSSKIGVLDYNSSTYTVPFDTASPVIRVSNTTTTPSFLVTADLARDFLNTSQATAVSQGRYNPPSNPWPAGCNGNANGYVSGTPSCANVQKPEFTFIDGDCNLSGGSGLLIVTGTLTINGNDGFDGIILILGTGKVVRSGNGNGETFGSFMVAKFPRNTSGNNFQAPYFDVSGGGSSTMASNSTIEDKAKATAGLALLGIAEK